MQPEFAPQTHWALLVALAVGSTAIVTLAALLGGLLRSAVWQRTVWQASILGLLTLLLLEFSGAGAALAWLCVEKTHCRTPAAEPPSEPAPSPPVGDNNFTDNSNLTAVLSPAPIALGEQPQAVPPTETGPLTDALARSNADPENPLPPEPAIPLLAHAAPSTPPLVSDPAVAGPPQRTATGRIVPLCLPIWGLGAILVFARLCVGRVHVVRFHRKCSPADDSLCARAQRLAARLGVRRPVRILTTEHLGAPVVFGGRRPAIIVPATFERDFDRHQQEAILAHELAHLAARDPAWRAVATLACAAWWWQPLAWWSRRKLHAASEAAADEASTLVPDGPRMLAASLVALGRRLVGPRPAQWLSVEGGSFRSALGRRVERLLKLQVQSWTAPASRSQRLTRCTLPAALALIAIGCTAWTPVPIPYLEGGTTMRVLTHSWRTSLGAAALAAVLGLAPGHSAAQDRPDAPGPPPTMHPPEAHNPPSPAPMPDRERMARRLEELKQKIQALEQAGQHEDAERLAQEAQRIANALQQSEPQPGPAPDPAQAKKMKQRLEQIHRQIKDLEQAGQRDEAERLRHEGEDIMRAMNQPMAPGQPGGPPGGPPPGDLGSRIQHLHAAAENLAVAGFPEEAEHVMQIARKLEAAARENPPPFAGPGPGPGRPGQQPVPPGEIQELRKEVQQMHREMQELRDQLKRLLDRTEHR